MKRRKFLAAAGGCGTLGTLWYALRPPRRRVDVRFWLTERAAEYEGVRDRVDGYLEAALDAVYDEAVVSFEGITTVSTEHGYGVMRSGEWPQRIAEGYVDPIGDDDIGDVNLLVTDGQVFTTPTGAGVAHVAAVGGARYLATATPRTEIDDVVEYTTRVRIAQVLIHEVGHALGLEHEHGTITRTDDGIVASPMVSSYAWADDAASRRQFDADHTACGEVYPPTGGGDRYLSFEFSACARAALREYRGGLRPR